MNRGGGMTELQRSKWLLSMPGCADMNNALQDLTNIGFQTSEKHKESTSARKKRDRKDVIFCHSSAKSFCCWRFVP